jgi:hypothetical protein
MVGAKKGGSAEDPTRPKPAIDDVLALPQEDQQLMIMGSTETLESNWDGEQQEGRNKGSEAMLMGEVKLEDEFCMEEEEDEGVSQEQPKVWRMLARYYSLKAANLSLIHTHFSDVWRIRKKMLFTPLKDNFFIITFTSEGDFTFVDGGGPWIHLGVACLIAPFVNNCQPSETVLDSVRLWVRFFNVPWNKQTEAYGRLIGSKLGKVVEVDVDKEGLVLCDYLRVRIDWPLNQRLLARFKTTIKGQTEPRIYPMRYERVPFFCFHCGLIGHNEEQCEHIVRGMTSLKYDATLRCSPKRKYEGRSVSTPDEPPVKKSLRFQGSEGSANSSTLGRPKDHTRNTTVHTTKQFMDIPPAVDAFDGFEGQEKTTDAQVEVDLANTVKKMELMQGGKGAQVADNMPGTPNFQLGGTSGGGQVVANQGVQPSLNIQMQSGGGRRDQLRASFQ